MNATTPVANVEKQLEFCAFRGTQYFASTKFYGIPYGTDNSNANE